MFKKFFISAAIFSAAFAVFLPFAANAQQLPADGSVLRDPLFPKKFLMVNGAKWLIFNEFTFNQLGIKREDILLAVRAALDEIPDGETFIIRPPRFSGILDMHEHYSKGGNMKSYLDVAAKLGVSKTVFLPTGGQPDNHGYKENMAQLLELKKQFPDRIIAFCTVDEADPDAPEIFKKCLDDGGKGIKLMAGHPNFYDVPIDDEKIRALFEIANERDVPVIVHMSIINVPKIKDEFMRLMDGFPNTRLQFSHYCSTIYNGINLDQCAEFLDKFPNMYIDLSMGGGITRYFKYLSDPANLQQVKDFIVKYQDRILYGTDMILA